MSEKRFECVFVEDEFGGTYRRLKDNETNIIYMTCDVADLLNFQNTQIKILKEENEQLKSYKLYSDNKRLQTIIADLKKENEQLKEELNNLKKDETMLYHYYTLARYGGDGV